MPRTGHGHGHGHGHGPVEPASRRVRLLLVALLAPLALATVVGMAVLYPFGHDQATGGKLGLDHVPVPGEVTAVAAGPCTAGPGNAPPGSPQPAPGQPAAGQPDAGQASECLTVTVRLEDGPAAGVLIQQRVPQEPSTPSFTVGDRVVLAYTGAAPNDPSSYQLVDFQRGWPLSVLAGVFALAVLLLGRWRGLAALGALAVSFGVLVLFVLPAILAGQGPLPVAVVGSGVIMFVALYITHGFTARTSTAILGTLVSLTLIGVLGWAFAAASRLTGLDEDTANLIGLLGHGIDARGLLLAGVIIGALGVLDDVTVTQASAVWELRRANPDLGWRGLYSAGLRIGRDHVGSAVNTLVMAYAGAALPMLLAYSLSGRTFGELVTAQAVAQEVVRTLVGSVGLVAAVPVTTALSALVASGEPVSAAVARGGEEPDESGASGKDTEDEAAAKAPAASHADGASPNGDGRRSLDADPPTVPIDLPPGLRRHEPPETARRRR
nr:YibE/F family protein [Longimycelium tulufanense]